MNNTRAIATHQRRSHKTLRQLMLVVAFTLSLSLSDHAECQDIHFSQIDINPILFNPAYSGFFDGSGRFGLVYRNQWASVSKAFQTVAATAEMSITRRRYYRDGLNLGIILYSDRAGTLHYGTTAGNLILSYYKALGSSNNNFISLALEASMGQAGFNTADIEMEDPSDKLENTSANFISLGGGAAWFYQPNDELYLKLGLSARNINKPDISYLELRDAFIERKFSLYARMEYRAWSNVSLMPLAACMLQNNYREILLGGDVKYYLSEVSHQTLIASAGLHYRWRDAALVELALEYNAFIFALTYDANLSKLTPASKSIGSFELGIVYRLIKNKKVNRKAMPCPII
ncbi:MAG: PorP/SprF family type IX secretion system membrane protein [Bacteroidales bacterium]|nr:PorP/SprF family type IX secretion system membrane protein [Bacteroidales bacterium]